MKNAMLYTLNAVMVILVLALFLPAYLLIWIVETLENGRHKLGFGSSDFKKMFQKRGN